MDIPLVHFEFALNCVRIAFKLKEESYCSTSGYMHNSHSFVQSLQVLRYITSDGSAVRLIMKASTKNYIYQNYIDLASRRKT